MSMCGLDVLVKKLYTFKENTCNGNGDKNVIPNNASKWREK